MGDEQVIKRRLLIDGDGTGHDRKINILLKSFVKWNQYTDIDEIKNVYYRLHAQLGVCAFNSKKTEYANKMIKNELKNYEQLSNSIESSIEIVKKEIDVLKENFVLSKKIRKNRMEYDILAKSIMGQPDRKDTTKQLDTLTKELNELKDEKNKIQRKLKSWQNDFFVLMRSIKELESKLEESSSDDDDLSSSDSSESSAEEKMSIDDIIEIPISPVRD